MRLVIASFLAGTLLVLGTCDVAAHVQRQGREQPTACFESWYRDVGELMPHVACWR